MPKERSGRHAAGLRPADRQSLRHAQHAGAPVQEVEIRLSPGNSKLRAEEKASDLPQGVKHSG